MDQALKSELTKQNIIDNAYLLFYEQGFKATSIDKIMKETKLTKGAFYHHYQNKKEIGLAVINEKIYKRLHESMIRPLFENGNALSILENTFLNRIKSIPVYDKTHGCPMNNFINEVGDYDTVYQNALRSKIEEWKVALVSLIERGQQENTIKKNINKNGVAIYLISAFEGIRGIRKLFDKDEVLDDYLEGLSLYIKQLKN